MYTIVADTSALDLAARAELLELLPEHFGRIIVGPSIVDELIEIDAIDALMASSIERMMEVVDLTHEDHELVERLLSEIAAQSQERQPGPHRGEAEALALMQRSDLSAELFLCEDEGALAVACGLGLPVQRFSELATSVRGDGAMSRLAVAAIHEPTEQRRLPVIGAEPREPESVRPLLREPMTIELDAETATLVARLVEQGVGRDAAEVVQRALRGLGSVFAEP